MARKRVLVDMDDTICHLVKRAIYYNNLNYPTHPLQYETMHSWDTIYLRHPECTQAVFFGRPGLYEELDLLDEYVVDELLQIHTDYDLIIATAAWPTAVPEKWNWLQKYMPFIEHRQFCAFKQKDGLKGNLLIDDGAHNLTAFMKDSRPVICIPHPWNQEFRNDYSTVEVALSWKGMKERIDRILGGNSE
jgi:5'(3')-deoxyribonucleotidase